MATQERVDGGGRVTLVSLTKRFGDFTAVDGIDLDMPPGEFFTMVGPSGCGKTTTLRMIAGFERPDEGQIMLDGADMSGTPPHKRNVNTVFQSYALFPHLSVADNVAFGLRYHKTAKADVRGRVVRALEQVQLTGFEARKPGQLSGGQQQRVACARALITRPDIIFADEPTGNLDSNASASLLAFLKQSVREIGQSIVMVTHDPRGAAYADRVVFLADGTVVGELDDPTADSVLERVRTLGG